jgi:signal transduction histidine kinase
VGQPVRYLGPDRLRFACRPVALRRALANLVDNAVKYGREAQVRLQAERDTIRLTIEDRGPGIPAAAREQVFQPFFRLEPSRSRATGGTGLGLAVARTIVHRHGGEITLDDRSGGGLVVGVTLPAAGS